MRYVNMIRGKTGKDKKENDTAKEVANILQDNPENYVTRVVIIRAPVEQLVPFLVAVDKPSEELQNLQKEIQGCEIYEVNLSPQVGLVGSRINVLPKT